MLCPPIRIPCYDVFALETSLAESMNEPGSKYSRDRSLSPCVHSRQTLENQAPRA